VERDCRDAERVIEHLDRRRVARIDLHRPDDAAVEEEVHPEEPDELELSRQRFAASLRRERS
jgi:hypothetical protein